LWNQRFPPLFVLCIYSSPSLSSLIRQICFFLLSCLISYFFPTLFIFHVNPVYRIISLLLCSDKYWSFYLHLLSSCHFNYVLL
jgi:hypothetical protein